ncbi:fluoride efflux transporter FluC [Herbiconiux sp. SYSU D00978]|uniref:fluoride efflux transporter FluC n=1 Tax=Herbiconiux sp. SYSU D00978 TaxID=2812562 RepID=UPI001A95EDE0|nr:CrcB family protein [Herbiconiux sp. SYSU D00978]
MIALVTVVAAALGAVLRQLVTVALPAPWGVLAVNAVGSALAGAVVAIAPADLRLVLVTGLAGGLTTFSTFSLETVELALEGRWRVAVASVAANLVLGIGLAGAGFVVASALV